MPKRKIKVKSGRYEAWMEVSEEEYQKYFRPWWQQKKKEQRKRETMEEHGYTEESYDGWKDGMLDKQLELHFQDRGIEEIVEQHSMLEILREALDSLIPEEKELAVKVQGEQISVSDFAKAHKQKRTTVSSRKTVVLEKLRVFFRDRGFEI